MARCDIEGCDWYGKASGKAIHMARMHGVHRVEPPGEGVASVAADDTSAYPDLPELHEPIVSRWSE